MKKQLQKISILAAMLGVFGSFAQTNKNIQPCATYESMEMYFKSNPTARTNYENIQKILGDQIKQNQQNNTAGKSNAAVVYTIPVVFHVLHQGGSENISDATIKQALQWVNNDYAKANSDATTTAAPFFSSYINSDIVFQLATIDPNGNCTNGIVRHVDSRTSWDRNPIGAFGYLYNGITWTPSKYLNIIIVKDIVASTGQVGTVVGYTFKPGTWPLNGVQDAIVYNAAFLGNMVDARSLSHEIGHWFNLSHTWGNTNNPGVSCGDDGITDTPVTKGEFGGCPSTSVTACTQTSAPMTGLNNVQNIMNYSGCPRNFTTGQTNAMRTAAASSTSGRNNLWSPSNLTATGAGLTPNCAPIAEYLSTTNIYTVCAGGSLVLKDVSYNGTITSISWAGSSNVSISNSTVTAPTVTFNTIGVETITLTATNGVGSSSITHTVLVRDGTPQITGVYGESFESGYPSNWSIVNNQGVTWAPTNLASYDGGTSMLLDGSSSGVGQIDAMVMPVIDGNVYNAFANPTYSLSFAYAYARKSGTHNDILKIEGSKDCGASWTTIQSLSAASMASGSGETTAAAFVPTNSQWKIQDITQAPIWPSFSSAQSIILKFTFIEDATSGFGNSIYIDALNFNSPGVGFNELAKQIKYMVYPNPSNGSTTVKFNISDESKIGVEVIDVLGKVMIPSKTTTYSPGEHVISLNQNNSLSKGIYFVNLTYNGAKLSTKLIIE